MRVSPVGTIRHLQALLSAGDRVCVEGDGDALAQVCRNLRQTIPSELAWQATVVEMVAARDYLAGIKCWSRLASMLRRHVIDGARRSQTPAAHSRSVGCPPDHQGPWVEANPECQRSPAESQPPAALISILDPETRRVVESAMARAGYQMTAVGRAEDLITYLRATLGDSRELPTPDLVVLEVGPSTGFYLRVVRALRCLVPTAPVVVIASTDLGRSLSRSFRLAASVILVTPLDGQALRTVAVEYARGRPGGRRGEGGMRRDLTRHRSWGGGTREQSSGRR